MRTGEERHRAVLLPRDNHRTNRIACSRYYTTIQAAINNGGQPKHLGVVEATADTAMELHTSVAPSRCD